MPVFNVLRIDEKQLAKVRAIRDERQNAAQNIPVENKTNYAEFQRWLNHIRKESKGTLTSMKVERIFD